MEDIIDSPKPTVDKLKIFYCKIEWIYPDGKIRQIPAGFYTHKEWINTTKIEQAQYEKILHKIN